MIESCCRIGDHGELCGIVTEPAGPCHRVANLFVNAGLVPKFGPYRLYVELARRLATAGFRSLRFDLGDLGDSLQVHSGQALIERTRLEIGAAIDHLHRTFELEGVVLTGLCSGAEDSFRQAAIDPRVVAVVLIDPFAYRTTGWHWRNALQRTTRRLLRTFGLYEPLRRGGPAASFDTDANRARLHYEPMPHTETRRILAALIDRGVRVHFIYTGGASDAFNHPAQLQAMFADVDFRDLVTVDHLPELDHTQPLQEERDRLIDAIEARLTTLERARV